jgi:hypothetical protein
MGPRASFGEVENKIISSLNHKAGNHTLLLEKKRLEGDISILMVLEKLVVGHKI